MRLSFLFFLVLWALIGCESVHKKTPGPYNVLFLVIDDLRSELGAYGADHIVSPSIDALAAKSLVFEKAYCQAPICSPSRMSFLTGLRPHETGINNNDTPLREKLPGAVTLPQFFKERGYQTEAYGKVFHQGIGDPLSWNYYQDGPKQRSTYHFEENVKINDPWDGSKRGRPYEYADVHDSLYTDGIIANRAIRALRRFEQDKPFFLAVGLLKPHLPFNAPKKYWDLYENPVRHLDRPPGYPPGVPRYAGTNAGELRKYHDIPRGPIAASKGDTLVHGYFACISYMDAQVGRILSELERLGKTESTIVVLFGDHGYKLGEYGDWCKNTHYDYDTRVPLILHHPDKAGQRTSSLAELVDVYPTLIEAAGFKDGPAQLTGKSLMPLFENPELQIKEAAFAQRPRKRVYGYSVRTANHKLIKWVDREDPDSVAYLELYDLTHGRVEEQNVAHQPRYKEVQKKLLALLNDEIGI